jgi:hypothetical protein
VCVTGPEPTCPQHCLHAACHAMAPMTQRRRGSPERTVLYTARHTVTDSVPQTVAARRMHRRLQQSPRGSEERIATGQPSRRQRDTTRKVAQKTWPPSSLCHDASGLALPAPMQLLLPADSSVPPFTPGLNEQVVTAPNTAHGRSGPAQLSHRLTKFERVSPDKFDRSSSRANWDSLRHVPRPTREPKPEPEQSGWHYAVQKNAAAPTGAATLRTVAHSSCAAKRALSAVGRHRPHTSDDLFTRITATRNSRRSSRLTASTPDGTISPRRFRLDTPALSCASPSQPPKDETGIVAKPKLATLRKLRPGSRHHVAGFEPWGGLSPNPFSGQLLSELKQPQDEQRIGTPEWKGAYGRSIHEAVTFQVKETAKALAAGPSNSTASGAKARISTQRQLTPDMLCVQRQSASLPQP